MTSGGREVDMGGGAVPNYKYGCNKPESEFLTSQAALLLLCIILNANRRTINGGGLGTRLIKY